jgi:hypothetical protein
MPAGTKVNPGDLAKKLESLDIDEGIRIESGGKKLFVNRSPSGTFVIQSGNEFHYLETATQVTRFIRSTFKNYSAWAY